MAGRRLSLGWLLVWLIACGDGGDGGDAGSAEDPDAGPAGQQAADQPEPGEELPGGAVTNTLLLGPNAFGRPAPELDRDSERAFFTGNSLFNESWVQAPASTTARDGLGPTFNARSCSGCHFKDGRGQPFDAEGKGLGMLLRLSVPGEGDHGAPLSDATYGGQLQDQALPDVPAEGRVAIAYEERDGEYADGEAYSLRVPTYTIEAPGFGALPDHLLVSPRVAPHMIGMGLLEAIPLARLEELADPDDDDDDGISGRINRVWDVLAQERVPGRFGWKAEQPSVLQQTAGAFLGDMGITSSLFPEQNCPETQTACAEATDGGDPEISDELLAKVALYASVLAVPVREGHDAPDVLAGKRLFGELGCGDCHTPSHRTGKADIDALSDQHIWPYTDLLLHDLGEGLSDGRPSFDATGVEWRTPPLWGLGRVPDVNGHLLLLHDGRARGFAEAILWHGGEAAAAAEAFAELSKVERKQVVRFLESL